VGLFGRRNPEPISIESEQERLRAIRVAAEQELGKLRRELAERVAAVEQRERELSDALARANRSSGRRPLPGDDEAIAHAQVGLAAHAQELNRRENELAARERAYLKMEADLARRAAGAAETPEERLAHIEARLATLQEAEKASPNPGGAGSAERRARESRSRPRRRRAIERRLNDHEQGRARRDRRAATAPRARDAPGADRARLRRCASRPRAEGPSRGAPELLTHL
jgi:hypothetical protein